MCPYLCTSELREPRQDAGSALPRGRPGRHPRRRPVLVALRRTVEKMFVFPYFSLVLFCFILFIPPNSGGLLDIHGGVS